MEFNSEWFLEKSTMIWYFQEGLRPLVKVKIEERGWELNSFKEFVKKAVDAKAKVAFWPRSYAYKTDQYYFRGSRPWAAKAST